MKLNFRLIILCLTLAATPHGSAKEYLQGGLRIKETIYRQTGPKKGVNSMYLEKIELKQSNILGQKPAMRINKELEKMYASFYEEARNCRDPQIPNPWGFDAEFGQINVENNTLSLTFNISAVCSGQPYFARFARNFSVSSGAPISPRQMLKKYAPDLLSAGINFRHQFFSLSEDALEYLIEKNEKLFNPELINSCGYHLHTAGHQVWLRNGELVIMPTFSQRSSFCFREYPIQTK